MTPDAMFLTWDETTQDTKPITRAEMVGDLIAAALASKGTTAAAVLARQAAQIAAGGDAGYSTVTAAGQEQAARKAA
jgi:hypothetical protein